MAWLGICAAVIAAGVVLAASEGNPAVFALVVLALGAGVWRLTRRYEDRRH